MEHYNFGPNVIYFVLGITESRPAGAFWADKIVFWARNASRRDLLGEIFDKFRIQWGMHIFEKMSQNALNQVLTLPDYRTQKML